MKCCDASDEKIFLLSRKESSEYGFTNSTRIRKPSDYAKAKGSYSSSNCGWWLLRSPANNFDTNAYDVRSDGTDGEYTYVNSSQAGVCPALCIAN